MLRDRLYEMISELSTTRWGTEKTLVGMLAGAVGAAVGITLVIIAYPNDPKEVVEIIIDDIKEEK